MLIKVLAPGFYARQDTRTPVRIGVVSMLANMLLGALLVWEWRHVGLASAMALSAWLNAGLLYLGLRRSGVYQPLPGWALQWLRMLLAGGAMVVACYWLSLQTVVWNEAGGVVARWLAVADCCCRRGDLSVVTGGVRFAGAPSACWVCLALRFTRSGLHRRWCAWFDLA